MSYLRPYYYVGSTRDFSLNTYAHVIGGADPARQLEWAIQCVFDGIEQFGATRTTAYNDDYIAARNARLAACGFTVTDRPTHHHRTEHAMTKSYDNLSHDDLVTLTSWMAANGSSADEIARAVEKPWNYEAELEQANRDARDDLCDTCKPVDHAVCWGVGPTVGPDPDCVCCQLTVSELAATRGPR